LQEFSYVYNNKIKSELKDKAKMTFEDVNVLLNAYEFYRYEMVSQKTLKQIISAEKEKSDEQKSQEVKAPRTHFDLIESQKSMSDKSAKKKNICVQKAQELAHLMN